MIRATELAHILVDRAVQAGDQVVDATVGNGHDTLFLAKIVGPSGQVIGFDVQEAALLAAEKLIGERPQVKLVHAGHESLSEYVTELASDNPAESGSRTGSGRLACAMFNLGYLPGGSKCITTRSQTTIAGLEQALAMLKTNGLVTLVLYPGHPGGAEEAADVLSFAETLGPQFSLARYARHDTRRPAPELLGIEKLPVDGDQGNQSR